MTYESLRAAVSFVESNPFSRMLALENFRRDVSFDEVSALIRERDALREALVWAVREIDRNTCTHDETHRGGLIWTICDHCGKQWADDRGGFVPYEEPKELTHARSALALEKQQ